MRNATTLKLYSVCPLAQHHHVFFILWSNFPNAETAAQREKVVFPDLVEEPANDENDRARWGGHSHGALSGAQPKGVLLFPK